jgi:uncharacterized NAD(P)/FAD-binding protein YdhS
LSESPSVPVAVVIGGGFSGAAVAAQLLRRGRPVHVMLVNRFGPIGRGVAYRTRIEAHVLNVPAGGMSALPDEPEHFLRWASSRDPSIRRDSFVSRRVYGEYLEALLREAEALGAGAARLERVVGEVRDLEPRPDGSGASVVFSDGTRREADRVVLALGNYSPNDPPAEGAEFYATDRYVRDPWIRGALDVVREGEAVLLLGTGLTTLDIALDLASRGTALPIRAVSRHGLLPHPHAPSAPAKMPIPPPGPGWSLAALTRWIRRAARETGDWRAVVGSLREATPAIWQGFTQEERSRFLRHARPWWDVHRHRAAPATAAAVAAMIEHGELRARAARVVRYEPDASGVRVHVRPRGSDRTETIFVERVVNCTGPSSDVRAIRDALLDSLIARGLMVPDANRLGVEVSAECALVGANGEPSATIYLVGPLLKARFWEATAVPELRRHAKSVAERLLP